MKKSKGGRSHIPPRTAGSTELKKNSKTSRQEQSADQVASILTDPKDAPLTSAPIMQLQHLIGNQAVMRLLAEQSSANMQGTDISPVIQRRILQVRSSTHLRKLDNGVVDPTIAIGDNYNSGTKIRVEDDGEIAKNYYDRTKTTPYYNVLDTGSKSRGAIKTIKTAPAKLKDQRKLASLGKTSGIPGTVRSGTELRLGSLNAIPGSDSVFNRGNGQKLKGGQTIDLKPISVKNPNPALYHDDKGGAYYLVLNGQGNPWGFVRSSKVAMTASFNDPSLDDVVASANDGESTLKTVSGSVGNAVEPTFDLAINFSTAKANTEGDTATHFGDMANNSNLAAGGMGAVTGLIALGYSWREVSKNPTPENILALMGITTGTAASIAVAVDVGAQLAGNDAVRGDAVQVGSNVMTESYAMADLLTTEAYIFSAILKGYTAVKSLWDMWENYDQMSGGEAAIAGLGAVSDVLRFAEDAVKTARTILDMMGTASSVITSLLPGITSAISVATVIIRTVDFVKAEIRRRQMAFIKREYEESDAFKNAGITETTTRDKSWYVIGGDYTKIENTKVNKDKLKAAKTNSRDAALNKHIGGYQVAKDLKKINVKREQRAGVEITLELAKIAGDIVVLAGGPAAGAGATTKIVAEATLQLMPIIRMAKQGAIDLAKKKGINNKYLDKKQSSKEKKATYQYNTATLFTLLADIAPVTDGNKKKMEIMYMEYDRVEKMFKATGVEMKALYSEQSKNKQFAMVVKAMGERG